MSPISEQQKDKVWVGTLKPFELITGYLVLSDIPHLDAIYRSIKLKLIHDFFSYEYKIHNPLGL